MMTNKKNYILFWPVFIIIGFSISFESFAGTAFSKKKKKTQKICVKYERNYFEGNNDEITSHIFFFLNVSSLQTAKLISKEFNRIIESYPNLKELSLGNPFQLFIKQHDYPGKTHTVIIRPIDTIAHLKQVVADKNESDISWVNLIINGRYLYNDDATIEEWNIIKESTLHLVLRVRGD